jgi:hypothetical protein
VGAGPQFASKRRADLAERLKPTTCAEWNTEMTAQQWFAGLRTCWRRHATNDGGSGRAGPSPDLLISTFEDDISEACATPEMSIAEVRAGIYVTGGMQHSS